MRLCTDTITVYNHQLDTSTGDDVYNATTIRGVSWLFRDVTSPKTKGMYDKDASGCTVRIPITAQSDKAYLPPEEYAHADPGSAYTLQPGDIIVRGEGPDPDSAAAYGVRPAEIQAAGHEHFTVTGVTDNRGTGRQSPHWKVVGV